MKAAGDRTIALLRGVNVGKAKRVAMADLKRVVEGLGYRDVKTLLNSGNVVFSRPASVKGDPAARIERAIAKSLGVACAVITLDAAELAEIVDGNPLLDVADDPSRLLVAVVLGPDELKGFHDLLKTDWSPDRIAFGRRAAYLWCASGLLESPIALRFLKASKERATTRNWATILKLHALASAAP